MGLKTISYKRWAVVPIGLLIVLTLFSLPLITKFFDSRTYTNLNEWGGDGWGLPFLRSGLFAAASIVIQLFLGFWLAVSLRNVSRPVAGLLVLLMIPALIGSVSVGFVFKLTLLQHPGLSQTIADRDFWPTWGMMLLIQCWQFLPLFIYMFWLRLQTIRPNVEDFAATSRLEMMERVRDIYWPHCRNLAVLLGLFGMIQGIQEYIKFHLILRASLGTGTEMASHRLLRYYNYYAPIDPSTATEEVLSYSAIFLFLALLWTLLGTLLITRGIDLFVKRAPRLPNFGKPKQALRNIFGGVIILTSLVPLFSLRSYVFHRNFIDLDEFVRSCIFTLLALCLSLVFTIAFGVCSRLAWPRILKNFNDRSLLFLGALYLLLLIPPIGLAFCGYQWIAMLGRNLQSQPLILALWLCGQVILSFPLIGSFILYNHFRVPNNEIYFQKFSNARIWEVADYSFLRRFKLDYFLVALFGFSIIWNESTLNSIVSGISRNIPSLAVELTQRVEGRANSYYDASNLILVLLVPILAGMVIWAQIARRSTSGN